MPASKEQDTGESQPNIFYEDYHLMNMRIRRVEHPYAHSQAAGHRTSHVISNVIIQSEDVAKGEVVVSSRFHMLEYRLDDQRYFGGKYTHTLKTVDSGYKIVRLEVAVFRHFFANMALPPDQLTCFIHAIHLFHTFFRRHHMR